MRHSRPAAGFTLLEVMIALAILAAALTILLRGAAANIANTQRAQMLTAVTELARSKVYDLEETLLEEGFQQTDQELEGDFGEEGWPTISWQAEILKIELPNLDALQAPSEEGGESAAVSAETSDYSEAGMIGQLMSQFGGGTGGFETLIYDTLRNVFAEAIRKIVLTVRYTVAGQPEEFVVDVYVTNPAVVNRLLPGGGAAAGGGVSGGSSPTPSTAPRGGSVPGGGGNGSQGAGR